MRYWIGKAWLKAFGWRLEGEVPKEPKWVFIAAPHTSNWDLPFMLAAAYVFQIDVKWLGKHTLFEGPLGWTMKALGGLPVDRRGHHSLVQKVVDLFDKAESLHLAIPPEGTRGKVEFWKSGFYHIAAGAKVPIVLGFLDFERKVAGLGPAIMPSGDVHADMEKIREFYKHVRAKFPEMQGVPRLREEGGATTVPATAAATTAAATEAPMNGVPAATPA